MKSAAVGAILLSGCTASSAVDRGDVEVSVVRPDRSEVACLASIRNSSGHSIFVLWPLLKFSDKPEALLVEPPIFTGEFAPLYHENELRPSERLQFDASCTDAGAGPKAAHYVGFYVCMHDERAKCSLYRLMWAEVPTNAT